MRGRSNMHGPSTIHVQHRYIHTSIYRLHVQSFPFIIMQYIFSLSKTPCTFQSHPHLQSSVIPTHLNFIKPTHTFPTPTHLYLLHHHSNPTSLTPSLPCTYHISPPSPPPPPTHTHSLFLTLHIQQVADLPSTCSHMHSLQYAKVVKPNSIDRLLC